MSRVFATRNAIRDAQAPFLRRGPAKAVLFALESFADAESGWSWPSLARLGEAAGLSERATWPTLAKLEAAGVLEVVKGGPRQSNRYRIRTEALSVLAAPPLAPRTEARSVLRTEGYSALGTEGASVQDGANDCPGRNAASSRTEGASVEEIREQTKEQERGEIDDPALSPSSDDAEDPFSMPDDWTLPGEARAAARMLGVSDVDAAWMKFVGHYIAKGEMHTHREWLALFTKLWCVRERSFESRARGGPRRPAVQPIAPVSAWKMGDDFGEVVETAQVARSKP